MKEYTCEFCNFKSNLKSNYNRHLNTKKHKNNEKEIGVKMEKKNKTPHKSAQILTNIPQTPHKSSQILTNLVKKYTCEFCGKNFKRSDNLYRHTNKYCKMNKMKQKEEMLIKQIEKNEIEKQKLYDYIDKLIDKTGDTYNIEQQNNQINLNNFGQEDVSHITDKFMLRLLSIPYAGVQKLIEKVHFNKKKPENKNIALTNKKEKMIKIYKNNKWKYKNRKEILDEIINTNYTRIDDFYYEKGKNKLNLNHNNIYLEFQGKFEDQDTNLHDKIKEDCEMILLSDNL